MSHATHTVTDRSAPTDPTEPTDLHPRRLRRLGGAAGLLFALSALAQNGLRALEAPPVRPSPDDLVTYATTAGPVTAVITALVAVNVVALGLFLAAVAQEGWGRRPGLVVAGLFGAAGVLAMFSLTAVVTVATVVHGTTLQPEVLAGVWALHDAAFAAVHPALGLALGALAGAGVAAGITPRVFRVLAPVGAGFLLASGMSAYWIAGGSPLMLLGLPGFLIWLAFLVTTGLRLVRRTG